MPTGMSVLRAADLAGVLNRFAVAVLASDWLGGETASACRGIDRKDGRQ